MSYSYDTKFPVATYLTSLRTVTHLICIISNSIRPCDRLRCLSADLRFSHVCLARRCRLLPIFKAFSSGRGAIWSCAGCRIAAGGCYFMPPVLQDFRISDLCPEEVKGVDCNGPLFEFHPHKCFFIHHWLMAILFRQLLILILGQYLNILFRIEVSNN